MDNDGAEFVVIATLSIIVIVLIMLVGNAMNAKTCEAKWRSSGHASTYSFWDECRVNVNGSWVPEGNVRIVEGR